MPELMPRPDQRQLALEVVDQVDDSGLPTFGRRKLSNAYGRPSGGRFTYDPGVERWQSLVDDDRV